jgi:sugar lactone lactonase YvrE
MNRKARALSAGHTFLEGPRWHDGDLYVSDFFSERVLRFRGGGADWEVICDVPGMPSGLGFLPDGDLVVVSMKEQRIMRWTGSMLVEWASLRGRVRGLLNDMFVDEKGRCYVGGFGHSITTEADFGPTSILLVDEKREVHALDREFNFPNGIVSLNGELLVAETYAGRIRAFELLPGGHIGKGRLWAQFGDPIDYFDVERAHAAIALEPDGLAVGDNGTVWVADAKGRGVSRVREGGEVLGFVETAPLSAYSVAIDPSNRRLFAACAPVNRTVDYANLTSSVLMVTDL